MVVALGSDSLSSALMVAELSYSSSFLGTDEGTTGLLPGEEVSIASVLTSDLTSDFISSFLTAEALVVVSVLVVVLADCLAASELFRLGTGELLAEGALALFCKTADSSQDDVEDPDSSSEDKVGGWSPVCVD